MRRFLIRFKTFAVFLVRKFTDWLNLLISKHYRVIFFTAATLVIVSVLASFLLLRRGMSPNALNPDVYDNVQVKITQSMESLTDETTSTVATGSAVSGDTSASEESVPSEPEKTVISTLQKQGDILYEEGISGKRYFYSRGGKNYVLYYDTNFGIWDSGKWTEALAENFNSIPGFDFDALKMISAKDFIKKEDHFVPKSGRLNDIFKTLLSVKIAEKYSDQSIKLWIRDGKIQKISADYVWDNTYKIAQNYDFTYGQVKLTIPESRESVRSGQLMPRIHSGGFESRLSY